jgi:hypothetical protein
MNLLRQFRHRPLRAWGALSEALLLLLFVRIGLRTASYSRLRRWLERVAFVKARTRSSVSDVTWAVSAAGRRITGTTCLAEALAVYTMLRRRGHEPLLRIGVRQSDHSLLEAHAWVECDGQIVMGEVPQIAGYAILA